MVIIAITVIFQPSSDRSIIALIYALSCITHMVVDIHSELDGFWYFFFAGVFDLAAISLIYTFNARTRLTDDLINISTLSIVLNAYGFVTWYNHQPILSYQLTMMALYFIAILSLLRKECANGNQPHRWHNGVRVLIDKGFAVCHSKQKEART
jgi:hypothetical protein